jgi:hypothetical protein
MHERRAQLQQLLHIGTSLPGSFVPLITGAGSCSLNVSSLQETDTCCGSEATRHCHGTCFVVPASVLLLLLLQQLG